MQADSIFTKIVNREIPSHKVYEDELIYAFLDIMPATEGHVLVIPKRQVEFVWDLDQSEYEALMRVVRNVALRIRQQLNPHYVGQLIVGTDVPHAHVHVLPFEESRQLKEALGSQREKVSDDVLAALAEKLYFE